MAHIWPGFHCPIEYTPQEIFSMLPPDLHNMIDPTDYAVETFCRYTWPEDKGYTYNADTKTYYKICRKFVHIMYRRPEWNNRGLPCWIHIKVRRVDQ